jgi:putative chitinase
MSDAACTVGLTDTQLALILPASQPARRARFLAPMNEAMSAARINTPLRQAHFLAQIGHESGSLRYDTEIASGEAYEGRRDLGNTEPGDGRRFKGRGLIQLTGRSNYRNFGAFIGRPLTDDPEAVARDPFLSVAAATWFWSIKELNRFADSDDLQMITRRINGGLNGFADRQAILTRAKKVLGVLASRIGA